MAQKKEQQVQLSKSECRVSLTDLRSICVRFLKCLNDVRFQKRGFKTGLTHIEFVARPMAAPVPTAEEKRAWLSDNVAADLTYIWEAMGVTLDRQYDLGQNYQSVSLFAALADTKADARTALGRDLGIDPAANAGARAALASVVAAWQQATDTADKERGLKAEARAMGLPKPLLQTERQAMRVAVERLLGTMDEREEPSPDYLAIKLEEVESGDLQASTLDEVGCVKDDMHGQLQSSLDAGGRLRIVKEKKKAKMPVNSEELRAKIRIECNTMLMLAARFRNKPWFTGLTTTTFQKYVDYLLGDRIFQLQIPRGDGSAQTTSANPSWDLMINFEHKLRKEAYRRASREGKALDATFQEVAADATLKETFFVTPLTLELARRTSGTTGSSGTGAPYNNSYGKWKGGDNANSKQRPGPKGGGKGKSRKGRLGADSRAGFVYSTTPDGRQICYGYNSQNNTCRGNCGRVHVCQFCLSPKHNRHSCPQRKEKDSGAAAAGQEATH